MPDDLLVADVETTESEESTSNGETETPSTEAETPSEETETPEGEKLSAAKSEGARATGDEVKAMLAEVSAKNPRIANQLKQAWFKAEAIDKAVPGGLREVRQLRQQVEALGGPEGVQRTREELEYFNGLDAAFTAGDPKFIQAMTDTPEGQQAFLQLAPSIMDKFLEMNPDGYGAYVSKVFVADMLQEGVPLALERLGDFIGDNPRAQAIWKQLQGYVNRINGFAQKPVAAPKKADTPAGTPDREKQLQEREQNITRQEWRRESDIGRMDTFNSEWTRLSAGRKLSDVQTGAVKELYASRLHSAASKLPGFNENLQRYFDSGDKQGYLRYLTSVYKAEIPKALRAAFEAIVPAKPGPKAGAPAAPKPGAPAAKPTPGFEFVGARPNPNEIDPIRSQGLILQGKAVLRSGKKVYWRA